LASNADELASHFDSVFYLTAGTELILERLRKRDGAAHATRFAAQ
jgi:dephospho-CoA kinase